MKNILGKSISAVAACLFGVACHGDLELSQRGIVSAADGWKNQTSAIAQVNGMMSTFRACFATDYMYWGEYRTGLWGKGNETQPSRDVVYNNTIASNHAQADWTALYTTINHANLAIKYIPGIGFDSEEKKNQLLGSAYFVRAFCYYWIGRIWGDAPVLTSGFESDRQEGLFPVRDAADLVFERVGSDLAKAEEYLKTVSYKVAANMPNLTAVYAMQTDYLLWMAKVRDDASALAKARTACDNAFTAAAAAGKELVNAYADVFDVTKKLNGEVIFAWSMVKDEKEGGFQADWLCAMQYVTTKYIEAPVKVGSHQQWAAFTTAHKAFIDKNAADRRARVSYDFFLDAEKNVTHHWINKYPGTWAGGARTFDSDIIVYRYADLVMFDAEIKNDQELPGPAVEALNKIAKRAYGVDNFYASSLPKAQIAEKILVERKKEFSAEGKLWWDYIRLGVVWSEVPSLVGRQGEKNLLLWPISDSSLSKNPNLKQTDFSTAI